MIVSPIIRRFIIFLFLSLFHQCYGIDAYAVKFEGVEDPKLINLLESGSQLVLLKETPPATHAGLRRRAESDINNLVKVLQSQAFYNARVDLAFDFLETPSVVTVKIDPGPVYPFDSFQIISDPKSIETTSLHGIKLKDLGITLDTPAYPEKILNAVDKLEEILKNMGYPYSEITERTVIADQENKTISVTLFVDSGPLTYFGPFTITGTKKTRKAYFKKKISWKTGERFSPEKIRCTQNALELSGLFSAVNIIYPDELPDTTSIPITIEVEEDKPRSLGLGVNYETYRGFGVSAEWTHLNLTGMADRLSFQTSLWLDKQYGRLSYIQPDFCRPGQDLIWAADYNNEKDIGYEETSYSLSSTLSRQVNSCVRISYGLMYKHLIDSDIHETKHYSPSEKKAETFDLFKTPFFIFWNYSNNILDPTLGYRLRLRSYPSWKFIGSQLFYSINVLNASYYLPIDRSCRYVLAGQVTLGAIFGGVKTLIPRSELFDAGTDTLLRGYKYKSVSPLDNTRKPTGGRSMLIYNLEARYRMNKDMGWVLFYDFGNVYNSMFPEFNNKILQSVGLGFRYFTPVGPIRLDLAFPLNPRRGVDTSRYQAYLSIGQTF